MLCERIVCILVDCRAAIIVRSLEEMCVDFGILVDLHFLQRISIEIYNFLTEEFTILKVLSSSLIC